MARSRTPLALIALAAAPWVAGLTGCVGYTTYPPANWQLAGDDINGPPADEIMIESLRWAIDRYPPAGAGDIAINLPEGVHDRSYGVIVGRVGGDAVPMERGREHLPTYHITRLWVRGDKAEVDVIRPVEELGPSPTGEPIVQALTVRLEGGMRQWRVVRSRPWVLGTDEIPPLHYRGDGSGEQP